MWVPKGAALIREWRLFENRCLLEKIRYGSSNNREHLWKVYFFFEIWGVFLKTMANTQVSVKANANIKLQVDLKLQLRRHTCTFIFTWINLIYLTVNFLCTEFKKVIMSENIFKFKKLFLFYRHYNYNYKLDDDILVTYFSGLQEPVLELPTNSITV